MKRILIRFQCPSFTTSHSDNDIFALPEEDVEMVSRSGSRPPSRMSLDAESNAPSDSFAPMDVDQLDQLIDVSSEQSDSDSNPKKRLGKSAKLLKKVCRI
jgi:hypothetical protein